MAHIAGCVCGNEFRFEVADLKTGIVRGVLHPVSADWETRLNEHGPGTLVLATGDVLVRDIWPHRNVVYITRLEGGSATPEAPVAEYAGIIEQFSASAEGTTMVGLLGIEHYLNHRVISDVSPGGGPGGYSVTNRSQTLIGKDLVELAPGIQLFAEAESSTILRDRNYEPWEYKSIGEAVKQLTEVRDGPDWTTTHTKAINGVWSSTMTFSNEAGTEREVVLRSDREVHRYGLEVDATNQATFVVGLGSGEEESMLTAEAKDNSGTYVRFDAVPAWKDVSELDTLQSHVDGYLDDHQEPFAAPNFTIVGLDTDPELTQLGDVITLDLSFGAVTYKGKARIISRAWRLGDAVVERTFEVVPLQRASEAILSQVPDDNGCKDC